jgi:hypothetical protein
MQRMRRIPCRLCSMCHLHVVSLRSVDQIQTLLSTRPRRLATADMLWCKGSRARGPASDWPAAVPRIGPRPCLGLARGRASDWQSLPQSLPHPLPLTDSSSGPRFRVSSGPHFRVSGSGLSSNARARTSPLTHDSAGPAWTRIPTGPGVTMLHLKGIHP